MSFRKLYVDIKDVKFSDKTCVAEHTLFINKAELLDMIFDKNFKSVDIELAFPGEKCRIASVGDIVEPTVKLDDEAATFPGMSGEMRQAGKGSSLFLRGIVVTETYEHKRNKGVGMFIDMYGEAAEHTIYSKKIHVVVVAVPQDDLDIYTYLKALRKASLAAAVYLAKAAKGCEPDEIKEYNLIKGDFKDASGRPLPRVAYVMYNCNLAPLETTYLYGCNAMEAFPTLLEPSEILDGALLNLDHDQEVMSTATYSYQNQPVLEELYNRHGKEVNFVGLVVATVNFTLENKKRNALFAKRLVKDILNADIVLITKESGGHPQIDCATLCDMCEEDGIQVAMIQSEVNASSLGSDEGLIFSTPNAKAIVSAGCPYALKLEKPDRVIGHYLNFIPFIRTPLDGPIVTDNWHIRGGLNQVGESMYTTFKY